MKTKKRFIEAKSVWLILTTFLLPIAMVIFPIPASATDDRMDADQLVEKARMAFDSMVADPNMEALVDLLKKARGVFICPELLKGAFIVGASGGSGVFLARGASTWYGPAFYTIGGASFGLQIGGQSSEVVLVAMTERGVTSLLSTSAKLGADAGIAVGPVGVGASAATANLSADIISFSRAKGLYGGVSLDGAVVAVRDSLNDALPEDISAVRTTRPYFRRILAGGVSGSAMPFFTYFDRDKLENLMDYLDRRYHVIGLPGPISVKISDQTLEQAKRIYGETCSACHGMDGTGTKLSNRFRPPPPDFTAYSLSPKRAFEIITSSYPGTVMPTFSNLKKEVRRGLVEIVNGKRKTN